MIPTEIEWDYWPLKITLFLLSPETALYTHSLYFLNLFENTYLDLLMTVLFLEISKLVHGSKFEHILSLLSLSPPNPSLLTKSPLSPTFAYPLVLIIYYKKARKLLLSNDIQYFLQRLCHENPVVCHTGTHLMSHNSDTVMHHLTTRMRSEKSLLSGFCHCVNIGGCA